MKKLLCSIAGLAFALAGSLAARAQTPAAPPPPPNLLNIETDNVKAEVRRLEALGGHVVDRVDDWVILQDPAGLLLCVISIDSMDFDASATTWTDEGGNN